MLMSLHKLYKKWEKEKMINDKNLSDRVVSTGDTPAKKGKKYHKAYKLYTNFQRGSLSTRFSKNLQ